MISLLSSEPRALEFGFMYTSGSSRDLVHLGVRAWDRLGSSLLAFAADLRFGIIGTKAAKRAHTLGR